MRARSMLGCAITAFAALSGRAEAQTLADRIAAVRDGVVTFHFTARPSVCGDGEHFIRMGRSYHGSFRSGSPMEPCMIGPVEVRATLDNGSVTRVQYWVGALRPRNARDLGAVPAPEAARYLMTLAARGGPAASAKAIVPAVLADSAIVWPALLTVARDTETRSRGTRQEAMHWLSRFASGAVAGRPNDPLDWNQEPATEQEDMQAHAVFVLSQLPRGVGITDLLEVARSNRNPRVRGHALFWLGQSGDPRAIGLYESLLRS
ncbi:MAG: hypothetical protein WD801_12655 [Gemmatimonadaceae bacterium]